MKPCPECQSEKVYICNQKIETNPECLPNMLPKLGAGLFRVAKFVPVICGDCGFMRYFADEEARAKLADSKFWDLL